MKTLKNYLVIAVLAVMQMLVVSSVFAQTEVEGVIMKSFYTPTKDLPGSNVTGQHGYLTLETYVTGEQITTHTEKTQACDIVLVLDQSTSMKESITNYTYSARRSQGYSYDGYDNNKSYYYKDGDEYYKVTKDRTGNKKNYKYYLLYTKNGLPIYLSDTFTTPTPPINVTSSGTTIWTGVLYERSTTRVNALKVAVTEFVNQVQANAKDNNVDHRMSIVSFGSLVGDERDYEPGTTQILSTTATNNKYDVSTQKAGDTEYKNSLVNVNADGSVNTILTGAIGKIEAKGYTHSDAGMDMAIKVFAQHNTADEQSKRQRVVVLFTDGVPCNTGAGQTFTERIANGAISNAKTLKNTYNAKVYSIAIYEGANPNAPFSGTTDDKINKYLHYVSSNYKNADGMSYSTDQPDMSGCYMVASDASQLADIFKKIAVDDITGGASNTTVTETTVAKGVLSPYFKLPDNITDSDIKVFVAKCNGYHNDIDDQYDSLTFDNVISNLSTVGFNISSFFDKATKSVSSTGFNYSENWCGEETEIGQGQKSMIRKDNGVTTEYRGYKLVMVFPVEIDNAGLNELWKNPDVVLDDLTRGKLLPINTEASGLYSGETGGMIAPYQTHKYYTTSPLPVELLSFSANCMDQSVQLTWSTASETNNEYFTIERSEDAIHYMEVARVQGAGTSAFQNDYSFMLDNTTNHTMYYRLRQTDIDGTTEVFEPIAVQCNVEATEVAMYPVPAKNNVTLQSNVEMQMVHIYNVYGALVNRMEVNANNTVIDLSSIVAGIYTVKITMANGEQVSRKLIKR